MVYAAMKAIKKLEFPHFLVLCLSYIMVFSYIPHKEDRFILPIYPFFFLLIGDFILKIVRKFHKYEKGISFLFCLVLFYDVLLTFFFYNFSDLRYKALENIRRSDPDPH
jgi:hypothetical protein